MSRIHTPLPIIAALALAAAPASAHPLDGLTTAEIAAVVEILKADGKADADARFPLIELREPDKAAVLAWKPGHPEARQAAVNVKTAAGTFKGLVDIANEGPRLAAGHAAKPCFSSRSSSARWTSRSPTRAWRRA